MFVNGADTKAAAAVVELLITFALALAANALMGAIGRRVVRRRR